MLQINSCDNIVEKLSLFEVLTKYDDILKEVFMHGKSAYMIGNMIGARIEFMERRFEKIVKVPFKESYESSDDVEDKNISDKIASINEECRTYCDTLFYINKYELLDFMNSNYNSIAKLNKVKLIIEMSDGINFKFMPKKKSVSVFSCEYKVDVTKQINPNFRIAFGELSIDALLLHEVLNNDLLNSNVRIEINTSKKILRASYIGNNLNSRFIIREK